jgi:predicted extracellular nuclease
VFVFTNYEEVSVQPGDVLDLSGTVQEYWDLTEVVLSGAGDASLTGETAAPVAEALSGEVADWEPYEGGLVTVTDVELVSGIDKYGAAELSNDLYLENLFYDFEADEGDAFSAITGALTYSYDEYRLCPRSAEDIEP